MEKIRCGGSKKYFHKDSMRVNINVSDICNFSCSYCINKNVHKSQRILDKDILSQFIEDLGERNKESYHFGISGGEPLIYPYIDLLVEKIENVLPSEDKTVCILTNGSLLLKKYDALYSKLNKTKLTFSISVHLEQINLKKFCDSIAKFEHLNDIRCKILLAHGKLDEAKMATEMLTDKNITTIIGPVTDGFGKPHEYSEAELDFLHKHTKQVAPIFFLEYENGKIEDIYRVTKGLHPEKCDFYGMYCLAGRNSLGLSPDGIVRRCFWSDEYFNLHKIRLRDISQINKPCVCSSHFCNCHAFLQMPKWIKDIDTPEYLDKSLLYPN